MVLVLYVVVTFTILTVSRPVAARGARGHELAIVAIAAMLPAAQVLNRPSVTYPLDTWDMYARSEPPRTFISYRIVDDHARAYDYPFALFAPSEPRAFVMKLDTLIARCNCKNGDATIDAAVRALSVVLLKRRGHAIVSLEARVMRLVSFDGQTQVGSTVYEWSAEGQLVGR
jgi:hypothetical protein